MGQGLQQLEHEKCPRVSGACSGGTCGGRSCVCPELSCTGRGRLDPPCSWLLGQGRGAREASESASLCSPFPGPRHSPWGCGKSHREGVLESSSPLSGEHSWGGELGLQQGLWLTGTGGVELRGWRGRLGLSCAHGVSTRHLALQTGWGVPETQTPV